ncbi:MAG: hypothetical protein QOF95_2862 [Pseudonocardiales bacterium]|nr:hypothetical protein [Pseudonocardiales bacterium]
MSSPDWTPRAWARALQCPDHPDAEWVEVLHNRGRRLTLRCQTGHRIYERTTPRSRAARFGRVVSVLRYSREWTP